jgi:tetratricopeptide (TPR) repeat protein
LHLYGIITTMTHQANQPHHQAEEAREYQDYQVALELAVDSELSYDEAGDLIGFSEIQATKALTYRQLFKVSKGGHFLVLAKYIALSAVEIARNSGIKEALAIPVFNLAKIFEEIGELDQAIKLYEEALSHIKNNAPVHHDREAVKLDFKVHLLIARLRNGETDVEDEIIEVLHKIESNEAESTYNKNVWVSGGYLKLAEIAREFKYLDEAKKIIESDDRLELRNIEWQELANELE